MQRTFSLALLAMLFSASPSTAQSPTNDFPPDSETAESTNDTGGSSASKEHLSEVTDFAKLSFILLMFTNAIICGHWALGTNRNFWGWYLAALFTGPLAGGFMLYYSALDRDEQKVKAGGLPMLAGIFVPVLGWFAWAYLLN